NRVTILDDILGEMGEVKESKEELKSEQRPPLGAATNETEQRKEEKDEKMRRHRLCFSDPSLPPPWKAWYHIKYKRLYYHNYKTGESTWKRPSIGVVSSDEPMDVDCVEEIRTLRDNNSFFNYEEAGPSQPARSSNFNLAVDYIAIFDTSALLENCDVIYLTIRNRSTVVIPYAVMRELDGIKKGGRRGLSAKAAKIHRELDDLTARKHPFLVQESGQEEQTPMAEIGCENADDRILKCALRINSFMHDRTANIVFVTDDRNLRLKGRAYFLESMGAWDFVERLLSSMNSREQMLTKQEEERRRKEEEMKWEVYLRKKREEERKKNEYEMRDREKIRIEEVIRKRRKEMEKEEKIKREQERKKKEEEERKEEIKREEERIRKEEEVRIKRKQERRRLYEEDKKKDAEEMRIKYEEMKKEEERRWKEEEDKLNRGDEKRREEEVKRRKEMMQKEEEMRRMYEDEIMRKEEERRREYDEMKRKDEKRWKEEEERMKREGEEWKRRYEKIRKEEERIEEEIGRREEERRREEEKERRVLEKKKNEEVDDDVIWIEADEEVQFITETVTIDDDDDDVEIIDSPPSQDDGSNSDDDVIKLSGTESRPEITEHVWDEYASPGEVFGRLLKETPPAMYSIIADSSLTDAQRLKAFKDMAEFKDNVETLLNSKTQENLIKLYHNLHSLHQYYVVRSPFPPKLLSSDSLENDLSRKAESFFSCLSETVAYIIALPRPAN
ncbi:hypothetical protein PFISCL1PPCAC_8121, partial [Pristionchus fissidentatus]